MSDRINMDLIDCKRIILEDRYEKLSCFDAICRNSVVDCFKSKCMNFFTKIVDSKNLAAYNTSINTGKELNNFFIFD